MTYSMMVGKYKLMFSDTHFKDFRKKPTISVYDADTNSETKIASFNSQETFEWFIEAVVEADRKTEPQTIKCPKCGRTDYVRSFVVDFGINDCIYKYKCINCNTYFNEPQTETEIAKAIVHKMIDDAVIAEDAYPDLRQKMHDVVDEYEPQTDCAWK